MLRFFLTRVCAILNKIKWSTVIKCAEIVRDVAKLYPGPQHSLPQAQQDAINATRRAEALRLARLAFPGLADSILEWSFITGLRLIKTGYIK